MTKKIEISSRGMIEDIAIRMSLLGTNPLTDTRFGKFVGNFYVICFFLVVVLMGINLWTSSYDNVGTIVKDLIIFIGFTQVTGKQFTALQQKSRLKEMIFTTFEHFWPLDTIDQKSKEFFLDLYGKINTITSIFSAGTMSAVYSMVFQTIFFTDKGLVLEIWIPYKEAVLVSPYYEIILFVQVVFFTLGAYVAVAQLDKLFIVMIALVFVQFKMIHMKIIVIGSKETKEENYNLLRDSVIHHNLILKFVSDFESVYSRLFLPTVGSNLLLATINMWGFITEDSLGVRVMCVCVYFAVMSQLLAYCLAGQVVQDAAMNLGQAAYNCEWTSKHDYKIRMGLIMIIAQSQRKIELTVGGFMVLCMESFAALSRASFTFLTFIINVRE